MIRRMYAWLLGLLCKCEECVPTIESGPEADLIVCRWCNEQTEPDMECWNCDEFASSEPRYNADADS